MTFAVLGFGPSIVFDSDSRRRPKALIRAEAKAAGKGEGPKTVEGRISEPTLRCGEGVSLERHMVDIASPMVLVSDSFCSWASSDLLIFRRFRPWASFAAWASSVEQPPPRLWRVEYIHTHIHRYRKICIVSM